MQRFYHAGRGIDLRRWLALLIACVSLFLSAVAAAQRPDAAAAASASASASASALASASASASVSAAPSAAPPPPPASAPSPSPPASSVPAPAAPPSALAPRPASSAAASATADVKVREKSVFVFRVPRAGLSPQERARVANAAIEALLSHPEQLGDVHAEETQGTATIYIGKNPVVTLGPDDVEASGEANLHVLSAQVTTRLSDAVSNERKRSAIATTVFSVSLLVFSALIAFLLLGRASELALRLRTSIIEKPEKVTGVRLGKVEFVSAGAVRGLVTSGVTIGYRLVQVAIVYGWLLFSLSLFDATRGYTERLTGTVLKPLSGMAERIGGALPLVVVAAIFGFAITALVRFIGLFFDSVIRGDTRIVWLPRDLARPTSLLLRFGIVVVALVLASPIITGESDGALSRAGLAALLAIGLATTPLLASAAVGTAVVFGRRVHKGDQVEIRGLAGRVVDLTLLDMRIEDSTLAEIRVPHLLALVHPTRVHRHAPLSTLDVVVDAAAPQADVERALFEAARTQSSRGSVELVYLDQAGAHYRITSAAMRNDVSLGKVVQDALAKIGVGLGRGRTAPPASKQGTRESP